MAFIPYIPSLVYEGYQVYEAISNDKEYGTTRNSSEQFIGCCTGGAAAKGGGMAGKYMGQMVGGFVGNSLCPGVGGPVCRFVGGITGEVVGATIGTVLADDAAKERASKFFDKKGYEIRIYRCKSCEKRFKCRIYTSQSRKYCKKCNDEDYEF